MSWARPGPGRPKTAQLPLLALPRRTVKEIVAEGWEERRWLAERKREQQRAYLAAWKAREKEGRPPRQRDLRAVRPPLLEFGDRHSRPLMPGVRAKGPGR
jgi:hypothetical protein